MANSFTATYNLTKPEVGASEDTWGSVLNANFDSVDDLLDGTTGITPNLLTGWEVAGVAVTSTAAELNLLDGVTSTTAELNILDGVTATAAEINHTDGVTSSIQAQLNSKASLASPALTGAPTAPTAATATNTTQLASTAFVGAKLTAAALSQEAVIDDTSEVFGTVCGLRLWQAIRANFNATTLTPMYACRAWVNFNGNTGTIRAGGNVSSVTRNGVGDYTVNFTTAMQDASYSVQATLSDNATSSAVVLIHDSVPPVVGSVRLRSRNAANGGSIDPTFLTVSIFR